MQKYADLASAVETTPNAASYLKLLAAFPLSSGHWIAYANHEFVVRDADAAKTVYETALSVCNNSCELWCAYLRFLIEINVDATDTFRRAESNIGRQFYSHKFWDLWLEYIRLYKCQQPLLFDQPRSDLPKLAGEEQALYFILKNRTLHQFSRYFRALKLITKLDEDHLLDLYTKQQARVSKVWRYERNLKRQVYHPSPICQQEQKTWISYIDFIAPSEKPSLYARATQIDACNEQLWMRYARWLIATKADPVPVFELASRVLPTEFSQLRLYYLLWLEHTQPYALGPAFERMPRTGLICAEHAKYLEQGNRNPCEMLRSAFASAPESEAAEILAVWSRYEPGVFDAHKIDSVDFYKSWIKSIPADADKVFELAPPSSVDAEYLRALRRTDLRRFVQMERVL